MKPEIDERQILENAKKKVRRVKLFYLHLALYFIGIALLIYNLFIVEDEYAKVITGLNISIIVLWTIVIIVQAWVVFKGKLLFNKSWEDKKIEEYLDKKQEQEHQRWE
ncbi:2TM domain-containing protein [Winogradskyella echinorum]|uniref:2TM domain-containing protein n=1 Tax=Winogradskyella echinorum TaxID=538189 RepID=A0ABR6Y3F3_9FLAO|nr:2TM domain-containing protein [Winogradskyella echinorum]MBC3847199.1 2TM domain-containing protein [Winogradskyella echinorum]MBC5751547.1 2TM domain-containing protein [Winogradskyella echinorum]